MKLPQVYYCDPDFMWKQMGGYYCRAYYDYHKNTIYVNTLYGLRFWTLFHEMGHWLLCLIPFDFAWYLNMYYDAFDLWLRRVE